MSQRKRPARRTRFSSACGRMPAWRGSGNRADEQHFDGPDGVDHRRRHRYRCGDGCPVRGGRCESSHPRTASRIGASCTWATCDIADRVAYEAAVGALPRLDILVNNAGWGLPVDALKADLEKWEKVFAINLAGPLHGCRAAGRKMVAQGGGGRIINVTSIHAWLAEVGSVAYGMAKAAVNQMTGAWPPNGRRTESWSTPSRPDSSTRR